MKLKPLFKKKTAPVQGTGSFKKKVESSSVGEIEYDAPTKIFSITFKSNGSTYDYKGVPQEVATKAFNSPSYGKLPNVELKGYQGVKRG